MTPDQTVQERAIHIERADDERLHDYTGLTDMQLRTRTEPERGLFIAEGEKVITRAVDAGYPMRSMLLSDKWLDTMAEVIARTDTPVYVGSPELLEEITGFNVHRGALAAMGRLPLPDPVTLLERSRRIVVLETVNNHTNIGAIFRSAAALGMDAVLLAPDCADPLYRRAVRVSMGTVFAVPYARLGEDPVHPWPRALDLLDSLGYWLMALTPAPDAVDLRALRLQRGQKVALLLGSEGDGLSPRALEACDLRVRIPMAAGVDSLNVAAAAAVACYALTAP
ncbi:MAG TPA: RNA methyltransferase [Actinocrinis sp.]|uniref:TrmH family RNA methyltransferase n=1 Tax=Actinocrinis sp. TaxID=1920516 RepID=UPI002DDCA7E5|nr:RNA methyltransferase [Actinocrinis sp.]HEV2343376.1 RNA methyltransferase [Actinocrinis sp.]